MLGSCANHPDTPASASCAQCGRPVCSVCVVIDASGGARCTSCAAAAPAGASSVVPWERRAELGTVPAFVATVKAAMLRPGDSLGAAPGPPRFGASLGFAVICHCIGTLFAVLWQMGSMILTTGGHLGVGLGEAGVLGAMGVFAGPLAALYWVFLWGGVVHLFLLMFGAARGGFPATARAMGYASASALWQAVPLLGGMIAVVWGIVIQILALAAAHDTSAGRTTIAVLAPLALCCLAAAGLVFALAAGFSSLLVSH